MAPNNEGPAKYRFTLHLPVTYAAVELTAPDDIPKDAATPSQAATA